MDERGASLVLMLPAVENAEEKGSRRMVTQMSWAESSTNGTTTERHELDEKQCCVFFLLVDYLSDRVVCVCLHAHICHDRGINVNVYM